MSRSTHEIAICASDWPRRRATSASARTCPSVSSLIWSDVSDPCWVAREPSGMPFRYFPVSTPCASGEKAMQPMPSRSSTSSRPPSIQRLSIE